MARHMQRERGQAMILVAIALIVLLAFVALAVDAGNLYGERRKMQNAADSGALAGARILCENWDSPDTREALAEEAAIDYAQRNDAQVVTVEPIGGGNIVTVTVSTTATTFLAGLPPIGVSEASVPATASAICGGANSTCYIWPIAFPEHLWRELLADNPDCDSQVVIIDDDKVCGDETGELLCGPGEVSTGGDRGWLDFAQPPVDMYGPLKCAGNCGAAALKCWIDNPYPETVDLPLCIKGEPGTIGTAFDTAGAHAGEVRKIPLYDEYTDEGVCPGGDPVLGDSCNSNRMYHVVDVACVRIVEYEKKYEIDVVGDDKPAEVKALIVQMACDECGDECESATYVPPGPGDVIGVSLIR